MLKFIAWSNIDGILLYSDFLLLNATVLSADWIGKLTITSAMISCNSNFFYCIFMPYDRIRFTIVKTVFEFFFLNQRQNITNSTTNSAYDRALK